MILAVLVSVLGFFGLAYLTQRKGLRLGGTIVIPTLAVYALKEFITVPIFLVSTAVGYLLLRAAKERTLVYGRDEFLVALAAGAVVPFVSYLVLFALFPGVIAARPVAFVGSILPGLAAFNLHQTKPAYRRQDVAYSVGLGVVVIGLGALLVSPAVGRAVGDLTPLVLFARTSDIAVARGAVVDGLLVPNVETRAIVVSLLGVGFLAAEGVRRRFGIRLGVVSLALLVLFGLASRWLLVLFLCCLVVSYVAVWFVHTRTLLYGRVLLSMGCGVGTLAALVFAFPLPIIRGFSALFVGVIAGVDAYNVHATPPAERRQQLVLGVAVFATLLVVVRSVVEPFSNGILQAFGPLRALLLLVVAAGCLALAARWQVPTPDDDDVLSASVLSGGDGA